MIGHTVIPSDATPPTVVEAAHLPGLAAGGIHIRPYRPDDASALHEAAAGSKTALGPWMPWCHANYSFAESEAWVATRGSAWAHGTEFDFVICEDASNRFLGGAGLNQISRQNRSANLGYWVRTDATGRGIASAAARLVARFGFLHVGLDRIEIVAAAGNVASQRAAEKAGAVREGIARNRLILHDSLHDAAVFSFIPADFGLRR